MSPFLNKMNEKMIINLLTENKIHIKECKYSQLHILYQHMIQKLKF